MYFASVLIGAFEVINKSGFKLNRVISPETEHMHLMEAIQEAELRFLLASLKDEIFTLSGKD